MGTNFSFSLGARKLSSHIPADFRNCLIEESSWKKEKYFFCKLAARVLAIWLLSSDMRRKILEVKPFVRRNEEKEVLEKRTCEGHTGKFLVLPGFLQFHCKLLKIYVSTLPFLALLNL